MQKEGNREIGKFQKYRNRETVKSKKQRNTQIQKFKNAKYKYKENIHIKRINIFLHLFLKR